MLPNRIVVSSWDDADLLQKLTRRTLALEMLCCNWDRRRRAEVAEILTEDLMSSEESEQDENGETVYKVRKLS